MSDLIHKLHSMKNEDNERYLSVYREIEGHFKYMSDENMKLAKDNSRLIDKNNRIITKVNSYKHYKMKNSAQQKEIENLKKTINKMKSKNNEEVQQLDLQISSLKDVNKQNGELQANVFCSQM